MNKSRALLFSLTSFHLRKCCHYFLPLLLFLAFRSSAQDTTRPTKPFNCQLSVGYGRSSTTTLLEGVTGGRDGGSETPISRYTGTFNASFHALFTPRMGIGIAFAFENEEGQWNERGSWHQLGTFRRNVYTIAVELLFIYSKRTNAMVNIYGYIGFGHTFLNEVDDYSQAYYSSQYANGVTSFSGSIELQHDRYNENVQICPIGIRVGRKLNGFAELGFGYKGIYNFGTRISI